MSQSSAMAIASPYRTACSLVVGSTPGCARHTGQVWTFGSSPNESSQPQNILVRVRSWT